MAPREHVQTYFRAMVPEYRAAPVGPFGTGLLLRSVNGDLRGFLGQWGLIQPGARTRRPASRAILTNNARAETVSTRPTYRAAWASGQRCLIPAVWYAEPNWECGRNIWWQLTRADGQPWAIAGLWSEWTEPDSGEIVPSFTMLTVNCDGHPLLGRLHKPDPKLAPDAQDKRSLVLLEPDEWEQWLVGDEAAARALLAPPPTERFDLAVTAPTDASLQRLAPNRTLL